MEKIYLRPMSAEEFVRYLGPAKENYAKEKEKSGLSREDAANVADTSFQKLLPQNEKSANQFMYSVVETESQNVIGTLWWGLQGEGHTLAPWIYDIVLDESVRGKGYGRATMLAAEKDVKAKGHSKLGLHVFGHNKIARKLYESLGFETTNVVMSKSLS